MPYGFSLDALPVWTDASFRYFEKHERHMTRICSQDVLIMVFDGVLRFTEDGVPVEVKSGEYYIQRSGLLQEGNFESDSPAYFFIHFKGQFKDCKNVLPLRGRIDFDELFPLFRKLEELIFSGGTKVEKASVVYQILTSLKNSTDVPKQSRMVMKAVSAVSSDFRKNYSVEELANICGYNENYFIKAFKKETGKTPYAYINGMKIEKAKQLLLNSDASLAQISLECGFGAYINFYKSFIKAEGVPPLEWKKKLANIC